MRWDTYDSKRPSIVTDDLGILAGKHSNTDTPSDDREGNLHAMQHQLYAGDMIGVKLQTHGWQQRRGCENCYGCSGSR